MGVGSIVFGLAGVGALATLMALDTARVEHGQPTDIALVLTWLNGGLVALALGLAARRRTAGRVGLALGLRALPLGLVAFGIFALTQTV